MVQSILKVDFYNKQTEDLLQLVLNYMPSLSQLFTLKVEGNDGRIKKSDMEYPHLEVDGHTYSGFQSIAVFIESNCKPPERPKPPPSSRDHMRDILDQGDDDDGMGEGVNMEDIQSRAARACKEREKKFGKMSSKQKPREPMQDEPDEDRGRPDFRRGGQRPGDRVAGIQHGGGGPGGGGPRAPPRPRAPPPPPGPIMGRASQVSEEARDLIKKNNPTPTAIPQRFTNIESDDDEDDIMMKKMMGKINTSHENF
jgi:hypothetical protein